MTRQAGQGPHLQRSSSVGRARQAGQAEGQGPH